MPDAKNNLISRRDFLKLSAGVAGSTVAAELIGLGLDTPSVYAGVSAVPIKKGKEVASVCPYCAIGCGQIVTVDDKGKIIDIQGHPDNPNNQGSLCPKGAATYQLAVNPQRLQKVLYRAPFSDKWEEKPLDWAMDRIAELTKKTRDDTFQEFAQVGDKRKRVMNTLAIASLGGSTMDNEWNYIWGKLLRSLGVVWIENQARI